MDDLTIKAAVEAILFASGDPMSAERIALVLDTDADTVLAVGNYRAVTLQKTNYAKVFGKTDRNAPRRGKYLLGGDAAEPCHFSRMRSQDNISMIFL